MGGKDVPHICAALLDHGVWLGGPRVNFFFNFFSSVCVRTKEAPVVSVIFCSFFSFFFFFFFLNKEKAIKLLG